MTIFIDNREMTDKDLTKLISEPDDLKMQIVTAWHKSRIKHCFDNHKPLNKAIRRNWQTLRSLGAIEFFASNNYLFSTKARGRPETLYFQNHVTGQTGRLRQKHGKGPLAKIDKNEKRHFFLSKSRCESVKQFHHKHENCFPSFRPYEERLHGGSHHIEFAYHGKKISGWHASEGTVKKNLTTRSQALHTPRFERNPWDSATICPIEVFQGRPLVENAEGNQSKRHGRRF